MWVAYTTARLGRGSRRTYIERLDCAVPHHILTGRVGSQCRRCATDDHVFINRYLLCPKYSALLGAFVGVILEHNASSSV